MKASEFYFILRKFLIKKRSFLCDRFRIGKTSKDDGTPNESMEEIRVNDFLYSDIYEAGLEERLQKLLKKPGIIRLILPYNLT